MSTPTVFRRAWRWSLRRSPIMRLARKVTNPMGGVDALLAEAGLGDEVTRRVRTIVRKTRLRNEEKEEITRELIAHGRDALEEGVPAGEMGEALGKPRVVARLMRRAVKRKRGWVYHARVLFVRTIGAFVLVMIVAYAGLWVRWQTARPTVTRNFIAELNAPFDRYGEDERAWEVYEEVSLAWERVTVPMGERQTEQAKRDSDERRDDHLFAGVYLFPGLTPDHPDYEEVADAVVAFRPQLDRWIEASHRPVVGSLLTDNHREVIDEQTGRTRQILLEPAADPWDQQWMLGVVISHCQRMRSMAALLAFDIRLAADEKNRDRVEQGLSAIFHMGRQLGHDPFLISGLVALTIQAVGEKELLRLLSEHPEAFDAEQLTRLAHTIGQTGELANRINFESERMMFEDLLQRGFTDDGHGNGRITKEGLAMLGRVSTFDSVTGGCSTPPPHDLLAKAGNPLATVAIASRQQLQAELDVHFGELLAALEAGPEELGEYTQRTMDRLYPKSVYPAWSPVDLMLPAMNKAVDMVFQARARTAGTQVVLAVEVFRRAHGRLPETLDELVPRQLPGVPEDPYDPGKPIKYVRDGEGFVLYYLAADGDDDGGRRFSEDDRHSGQAFSYRYRNGQTEPPVNDPNIPDGDWVLYPLAE